MFSTGLVIALSACSTEPRGKSLAGIAADTSAPAASVQKSEAIISNPGTIQAQGQREGVAEQQISLESPAAQAVERKVIKNAELTIETDTPAEDQRKIAAVADKHNGFVVISESKQNEARSQNVASMEVNVVVRVPAREFDTVIAEIRGFGDHVPYDKSWSQDVTEEYIDLEARIRTKKALETQFMEIMKQARKISDALEVQTQLAEVRTEIERLEGRRRFLENQSALSTIKVTLRMPTPVVASATRGFLYDLKAAFADGIDFGTGIFLGVIRFVIVMIPLALFILVPGWFVFKWARRRFPWPAKQAVASATSSND
jgi:hypothetical protein